MHIAGGERAAVVEADARAQVKREGQRVGLLPAFGQRRREVKARIAGDKTVEQKLVDMFRLAVGSDARIEVRRAALDEKDHRPQITGRGAAACQGEQASQHQQPTHR